MEATSIVLILDLLAGAAILLLGRRLFWLSVAVVGFLASFELAPLLLPGRPEWVVLLVSVGVGFLGAFMAIGLQWVAAAVVGFVGGSYASMSLVSLLSGYGTTWIPIVGGIAGAVLMAMVFDYTLIIMSALAGSRAVLLPFELEGGIGILVWLLLAAVGIAIQVSMLAPATTPRRRHDPGS